MSSHKGEAWRALFEAVCDVLEASGSEDGRRLRAAVTTVEEVLGAAGVRALAAGDVAGAAIEAAHSRHRRARGTGRAKGHNTP